MKLLRSASMFAQPEEGGDDGKPEGDAKPDGKPDGKPDAGDQDKPIPYSRFKEVNDAKRTAETELKTAKAEVTRLTTALEQAQSGDQAAALKTAQGQVAELQKAIDAVNTQFEDMLEVALADVPKEQADMIREIPGGAQAQFAWFNKHRARLTSNGDETPTDKGGPKGPKNERKPDGGDKAGPSTEAKAYVESSKPKEVKGFAGLA